MPTLGLASNPPVILADALFLVSPWKPLIFLATLIAWGWVVSTVYDKHAARFFLPRTKWNLAHLSLAAVGSIAAFMVPVPGIGGFFAGWGVLLLFLGGSLLSYMISTNKDDRVPEAYKIRIGMKKLTEAQAAAKKQAKAAGAVKLAIKAPDKTSIEAPAAQTPEYEVRTAAETLYIQALSKRAAQVDIIPAGKDGSYAPSFMIDAVRHNGEPMPGPNAVKIMDFWKSCAKLDLNDRRRKLTGDIVVSQGADSHKVRVSSIGVSGGMRLTMRFDVDAHVRRKPDDLGLLPEQMAELKILTGLTQRTPDGDLFPEEVRKGVVLLAGQADGGRTTTLLTLLQMHDAYTSGVVSLEVESEVLLEGIRHVQYDPTAEGADFATTVRSQLRRDPDVLGVCEVPDAKTCQEAARGDTERTRTYLAMRADSTMAAIEAYMKALSEDSLAAKSLRGVICHKLMRRLCTNCRVGYPPSADILKKLGLAEGKVQQLFKKGGQVLIKNKPEICPVCAGIGYYGIEGIFEVYRIGMEEREFIETGNLPGLKAALRKKSQPTLQQAALKKAIAGVTSLEEVTRVTSSAASAAVPATAGA